MHEKRLLALICAVGLGFTLAAQADEAAGIVSDAGFGKLTLKDKKDVVRQFSLSQKETKYSPEDWRPGPGDSVTVTFTQTEGRRGPVLVTSLVKLDKAGPSTIVNLKSPVAVSVTEYGRTGIKAKLPDGKEIKFTRHSGTVYTPAGWQPAPGEKARVTFRVQPARVGLGLNYLADSIEKVN